MILKGFIFFLIFFTTMSALVLLTLVSVVVAHKYENKLFYSF